MKTTAIAAGTAVTGAMAAKVFRKIKAAETLGTYKYKGATLTLWGYTEGKAGTENKHELPPPHDEALFFGDIVVVSSKGDLTMDEWSQFYDEAFGGFEDLDSEDDEEESEAEEEDEDGDADELDDDAEDEEEDDESESEEGEAEEEDVSESEAEEEEEEEAADDDCYDDEDAGGSKRRAPRRRTVTAPEYRRLDMGLKSRVKVPSPPGKRAPRWQTAPELEPEAYE